eukprot:1979294-Lingulodinium_polyedra.AAC.1
MQAAGGASAEPPLASDDAREARAPHGTDTVPGERLVPSRGDQIGEGEAAMAGCSTVTADDTRRGGVHRATHRVST